jgi:TonB-linked SusC/RagA family outer membrane protein
MRKLSLFLTFVLLVAFQAAAQMQVSGTVTNVTTGDPIPGVSIVVKSQVTLGTSTDMDGHYTLKGIPSDAQTLVFSFVGMKDKEVALNGQSVINVALEEKTMEMDEVVVVAYGSRRKGGITGSVDVVNATELEDAPAMSFDQMLQGKATGVEVTANSGRPGAAANVNIRGIGSVNAGNQPLYVVDGVPVEAQNFSALNPSDIESISILKDASASSIYGSRAANGVVLVTTKTGRKDQEARITYRYEYGTNEMLTGNVDMMNAREKLNYENATGYANRTRSEIDSLAQYGHDWFNTLSRRGATQKHFLSARGGGSRTTYYFSLSNYNMDGVVEGSYMDRTTGRLNVSYDVSDDFTMGTKLTVGGYQRGVLRDRRNVQNPFAAMFYYNPYEPEKLPNGEWNPTHQYFSISEALENNPESLEQIKSVGNVFGEYQLMEGLKFKTQVGLDFKELVGEYYNQPGSILAGYVGDSKRDNWTREYMSLFTNTLNYQAQFNSVHNIDALVGTEYNRFYRKFLRVNGKGFPSAKVSTMANAAEINGGTTTRSDFSLMSYFSKVAYDYNNKYYLDLSYRRDGSSRFGEENRWSNFWSVGSSWNMHQEAFMEAISFIDRLKVRGSIGTTGNYNIGNYASLGLWSFGSYSGASASYQTQIENPGLTWEKSLSKSVGIEYALFNNRLTGSFNYYVDNTNDMLFEVELSRTSGFSNRIDNVGSMTNKGIELAMNYDIIENDNLQWNMGFQLSRNVNEVTKLAGEDIVTYRTIIREGEPIYSFYMVRYAGVNPDNGEKLYYDKNGEITNVWSGDDAVLLNKTPHPDFYGNVNTSLTYKDFNLRAVLYYTKGNYITNGINYFTHSDGANVADNQSRDMLNYWKEPGDVNVQPKPVVGSSNHYTDRYLEDASYMRLREVRASYTLPEKLTSKVKLNRVSVFLTGKNLFTYAPNFTGFDPEVGTPSEESSSTAAFGSFYDFSYPTTRTYMLGLEVRF